MDESDHSLADLQRRAKERIQDLACQYLQQDAAWIEGRDPQLAAQASDREDTVQHVLCEMSAMVQVAPQQVVELTVSGFKRKVRNRAKTVRRRGRVRPKNESIDGAEDDYGPLALPSRREQGPMEQLCQKELVPWVWGNAGRLPERQGTVLRMVYLEDQRVADVALALNVPKGTVTSDLVRGRKQMQNFLGSPGAWLQRPQAGVDARSAQRRHR